MLLGSVEGLLAALVGLAYGPETESEGEGGVRGERDGEMFR